MDTRKRGSGLGFAGVHRGRLVLCILHVLVEGQLVLVRGVVLSPMFPPCLLRLTRFLLPLGFGFQRRSALRALFGVLQLISKQSAGNGTVLRPRSSGLRFDYHSGGKMFQLHGRRCFVLDANISVGRALVMSGDRAYNLLSSRTAAFQEAFLNIILRYYDTRR